MTEVSNVKTRAGIALWIWWAVGATLALTAFGVFALPWLVPVHIKPIVSESQALGFNNRVALASVLLGLVVIGMLGQVWRQRAARDPQGLAPVVLDERVDRDERTGPGLVLGLSLVAVGSVALLATVARGYLSADAAYFADRLLYLVNGSRFYVDFAFSYGPLLIYPAYFIWLVGHNFGMSAYAALYLFVAALHVLGIGMAVYLLNRLRMSKGMREAVLCAIFSVAVVAVLLAGPNYMLVRFLTPFVLLLWAMEWAGKTRVAAILVPTAAVVIAFLLSPEMGVATVIGLVIALALAGSRQRWWYWGGAVIATAAGVIGWQAYASARTSALVGMAGGSGYLPVLPGAPAVLLLVAVFGAGWGVAVTSDLRRASVPSVQIGWLASAAVLLVAAMGRADWAHTFWNGLGAILLLAAFCFTYSRPIAYAYVTAIVLVFFGSAATAFELTGSQSLFASGVNSGAISEYAARGFAHRVGRKYSDGSNWWHHAAAPGPNVAEVEKLTRSGKVLVAAWLQGAWGERLATRHALTPMFDPPYVAGIQTQFDLPQRDLEAPAWVLMPTREYDSLRRKVKEADKNGWQAVRRSKTASSPQFYALQSQYPISIRPANPVLDPAIPFGRALERDWIVDHTSGGYVILRPR